MNGMVLSKKSKCEHCDKYFTEINNHMANCPKKPVLTASNKEEPVKARFEGSYFIWTSGHKTHLRFIQDGIAGGRELPEGFYEAAKNSSNPNIKEMARRAKEAKLKDTAKILDTRS